VDQRLVVRVVARAQVHALRLAVPVIRSIRREQGLMYGGFV
jgi:hypothetical protein